MHPLRPVGLQDYSMKLLLAAVVPQRTLAEAAPEWAALAASVVMQSPPDYSEA